MDIYGWLDAYLLEKAGTVKDYKIEWEWERYRVCEKMYAAFCQPGEKHAKEYAGRPLLSLKCDPLESELLRSKYPDILPGFYMDKRSWISVRLDGSVPKELLCHLCDESYRLVFSKLTKKLQRAVESGEMK